MAEAQSRENFALSLLARSHSPDTAASIHRERIKQKPLLLRASSPDSNDNARTQRQKARKAREAARRAKKPKPLSAAQKRSLGIYDIPKSQRKYAIYEPLHEMWCAYMREILGLDKASATTSGNAEVGGKKSYVSPNGAGPMLLSADYHGALVEVVRSGCVSRVGLKGIVVKDTKFTFDIVTHKDVLKTVPKEHTIFRFNVPVTKGDEDLEEAGNVSHPMTFEIHGSQFENRPPDRANKKFKSHISPDL